MTAARVDSRRRKAQSIPSAPQPQNFSVRRLSRSGARSAEICAADIWSGAAESVCADGAVVRHEARFLIDSAGAPFLHILGERRVAGKVEAWHAVLIDRDQDFRDAIAEYDPARLVSGFDLVARLGAAEEDALKAFAEDAGRAKADLETLIDRLSRPGARRPSS